MKVNMVFRGFIRAKKQPQTIDVDGNTTLYKLRSIICSKYEIDRADIVQMRFPIDEWKFEIGLTNKSEQAILVKQISVGLGVVKVFIRRGTSIQRSKEIKNVLSSNSSVTCDAKLINKSDLILRKSIKTPNSLLAASVSLLKLINTSKKLDGLPDRPCLLQSSNRCLRVQASKYTLKQLQHIFEETVGKNISSNSGEYENYSQDTAYQLLSNEVLLSIRDSLRHMKKLGIHDGTAFEDINATKIYRKMKKFKQSGQ